ncbi:MAG: PEP-CTERM system TPR-repeat protein PrsT [Ectothiorhodospiraceae bacterium]|nr:PEP-CTERM system TPR-repeat protein PrsT [Ectothiorhodospiraceae bacterium]
MTESRSRSRRRSSRRRTRRIVLAALGVLVVAGGALAYVLRGGEGDAREHLARATEFEARKDYRSAVVELKNALQLAPDLAPARALLGRVYLTAGNGAAAQKELERARELGHADTRLGLDIARALLLQGRFQTALDAAQTATDASGAEWRVVAGEAALGLQRVDEAKAAFEAALAVDPTLGQARRGLARVRLANGDTDAAQRELEEALASSEREADTWVLKGELELSLQRFEAAKASFEKVLELVADSPIGHIGVARAALGLQDPDAADRHLSALDKALAKDPRVTYLRALVARQRNQLEVALEALRDTLAAQPNHVAALLLAGQIHFLRREFTLAAEMLERHVTLAPTNTPALKLLGAVLLELKQTDAAIETLGKAAQRSPDDAELLALLGTAHMSRGDTERGRELLDQASRLKPDNAPIRTQLAVSRLASGDTDEAVSELEAAVGSDPGFSRADVLLVLTHFQARRYDKALEAARQLVDKRGDQPAAHNLLGAALEASKNRTEARAAYTKALEIDPSYVTALLNLARMDLQDGAADQARTRYDQVLERRPDHPTALVALAKMAADAGRSEEGIGLLERARTKNPSAVEPRLILTNYHLRQGNRDDALRLAREASELAPDNPLVLLGLGRAELAAGQASSAARTLQKLLDATPRSAEAWLLAAQASATLGRNDEAQGRLEKALELEPTNENARYALGGLQLRTGQPEQAAAAARQLLAEHPDSPSGDVLQGDTLMAGGKPNDAVVAYRRAFEKRSNTATLLKLHAAQRATGDTQAARGVLESWLEKYPADAAVRVTLASSLHGSGATTEAAAQYEKVLEASPDNVLALNNLAWLYHEAGDARAQGLAERAYRMLPDRPEIADTYGWLLAAGDQVEQALTVLRKAAEAAPGNGDIQYHYAAVLERAGDKAAARRVLERALSEIETFAERASAETLLDRVR